MVLISPQTDVSHIFCRDKGIFFMGRGEFFNNFFKEKGISEDSFAAHPRRGSQVLSLCVFYVQGDKNWGISPHYSRFFSFSIYHTYFWHTVTAYEYDNVREPINFLELRFFTKLF